MVNKIADAANAYAAAAGRLAEPGMPPRDVRTGSFAEALERAARDTIGTVRQGEMMSAAAVIGKADLTDVVAAVTSAEMTVQTVVAVRDRVIQAYQEILRMPI